MESPKMPYTISQIRAQMTKTLLPVYGKAEAGQMIKMLFEHFCGLSGAELVLKGNEYIPLEQYELLLDARSALADHEPIQYIIGSSLFADLRFEVNPSVLIPRPETEELVSLILAEAPRLILNSGGRLLDIGTGSGCIAVALNKSLPDWKVEACDVSEPALQVARRNAHQAGTAVNFFNADILRWKEWPDKGLFNIIVSNPPYVCRKEKEQMQPNVLEHEPALALFVTDDDPLVFYRAIAGFASKHLAKNGNLYLEINESYGAEIQYLLTIWGLKDVEVRKDFRGKDRFAVGGKE
jgi:release factor glutamine methyltransferase